MKMILLFSLILLFAQYHCCEHSSIHAHHRRHNVNHNIHNNHHRDSEDKETRRGKLHHPTMKNMRRTLNSKKRLGLGTDYIEDIPEVTAAPNGKSLRVKLNHESLRSLLDMLNENKVPEVGTNANPAFTPAAPTTWRRQGSVGSSKYSGRRSENKGPVYNSYSAEHKTIMDMVEDEFQETEKPTYEKQKVRIINPVESRIPAPGTSVSVALLRRYMIERADQLRAMPTATTTKPELSSSKLEEKENSKEVTGPTENGEATQKDGAGESAEGENKDESKESNVEKEKGEDPKEGEGDEENEENNHAAGDENKAAEPADVDITPADADTTPAAEAEPE